MTENDRVVLTVPARGEYARTVRITAAELAARVGMTIDDVDDVKLAVEEAFVFSSAHLGSGGAITFSFSLHATGIELLVGPLPVECAREETDAGERYARFILESVCDEFEILESADGCMLRLLKLAV